MLRRLALKFIKPFIFIFFIILYQTSSVAAQNIDVKPFLWPFYDPNACSDTTAPSSSTGDNVYVLGDSITERASSKYTQSFQSKGITVNIDASVGRSIDSKGTTGNKLSGMQAISQDKNQIKQANVIIVALGTNGGDTTSSINRVINALRADNSNAQIYWIDTISVGRSDNYNSRVIGPGNRAIYNQSDSKNYKVLSWFKTVDPNGDPRNPTRSESDSNGYIDNSDGLGVHPNSKGVSALVDLVVGPLSNPDSGSATPTSAAACCSGGNSSGTVLKGNGNGEKVFNYFIGKGLSNASAAAVTGNLEVESAGFTVIDGWGGGGGNYYGLAQWDRTIRYARLVKFAGGTASAAKLSYQLDFVWYELHNGYGSTLQNLKGNSSIRDKAIFWGRNYEGAVNSDGTLQMQAERIAYAIKWFNKVKGVPTPPDTSTADSSSDCSSSSTADSSGYSNPFHNMSNLVASRIDEGVDYYAKPGTTVPVYAIGDGKVTKVADGNSTFYPPLPNWITYKLTSGPARGEYVYVSEACPPEVHEGQKVTKDTLLCKAEPASIETGWALDSTSQAAAAIHVYTEGYETAYGVNFNQLLVKLGAPSGHLDSSHDPSGKVLGTLPGDWPTWK